MSIIQAKILLSNISATKLIHSDGGHQRGRVGKGKGSMKNFDLGIILCTLGVIAAFVYVIFFGYPI